MILLCNDEKYKRAEKTILNDKMSTAFHEAGHAIAHIVLKIKFSFVTIRKRGSADGYVTTSTNVLFKNNINRIRREIMVLYAGDVSEWIYLTLAYELPLPNECEESQLIRFSERVQGCDDEESERLGNGIGLSVDDRSQLYGQAKDLIIENWESVKKVGYALMEKKRLQYFQVRRLLGLTPQP